MTTSGVYSFAVTRDDIIRQALLNIKKLDPFETPDSRTTTDCAMVLNMIVKQRMGRVDYAPGLKVWTRKRGYLFLNRNSGQYTLSASGTGWTNSPVIGSLAAAAAAAAVSVTLTSASGVSANDNIGIVQTDGSLAWTTISALVGAVATIPSSALTVGAASGATVYTFTTAAQFPVYVETCVLRDSNLVDTPINIVRDIQTYDALSNKAQPTYRQDPTAIYWESGINTSVLRTDCGGSADLTKYLILTYLEPIQDFVSALDNPYFPQEYFLDLCWSLSKFICPQFGKIWTPAMEDNYKIATTLSRNKDPEVSMAYFQCNGDE